MGAFVVVPRKRGGESRRIAISEGGFRVAFVPAGCYGGVVMLFFAGKAVEKSAAGFPRLRCLVEKNELRRVVFRA